MEYAKEAWEGITQIRVEVGEGKGKRRVEREIGLFTKEQGREKEAMIEPRRRGNFPRVLCRFQIVNFEFDNRNSKLGRKKKGRTKERGTGEKKRKRHTPSTTNNSPHTYWLALLAKNTTGPTKSAGSPHLPAGMRSDI